VDFSLVFMVFLSCFVLTCCVISLVDHSQKGQVLFQLRK
jgi:hypothetical protein